MGQVERLLPGVYGKVGAGETLDGKLQAVRAYGDEFVVTRHHAAALTWWPEVECPSTWRLACPRAVEPGYELVSSSGLIPPPLLTKHQGCWLTAPALTVLDLIPEFDADVVYLALRRRAVTVEQLQKAMALTPRRRGNRRRREILAETASAPWSHLERDAHRHLREAGLTGWRSNHRVDVSQTHYYIDAAFLEEKVGVELDGFEFHSSRDAFERGRARDADLAAVGWLMVHFTAETASDIGKRTAAR